MPASLMPRCMEINGMSIRFDHNDFPSSNHINHSVAYCALKAQENSSYANLRAVFVCIIILSHNSRCMKQ